MHIVLFWQGLPSGSWAIDEKRREKRGAFFRSGKKRRRGRKGKKGGRKTRWHG